MASENPTSETNFSEGPMTLAVLIVVFFVLLAALMWSRSKRRAN